MSRKSQLDLKLKEELVEINNIFKEKINNLEKKKSEDENFVDKKINNKLKTLNELHEYLYDNLHELVSTYYHFEFFQCH